MQIGWLLAAMISAGAIADTPADIARSIAEKPPADLDAYYAMKTRLGPGVFDDVITEVSKLGANQAGIERKGSFPTCRLPDWELTANPALMLTSITDNDAEWAINHAQIDNADREAAIFRARIMAGENADPAFADVTTAFKRAASEKDVRARAFAQRVAEDQFDRVSTQVLQQKRLWARDVNPKVQAYLLETNAAATCRTDRRNTDWLKADVKTNGWPRLSTEGVNMAGDAWLLVQHADHDPAFQQEVLMLLEALLPSKDASPQSYALLYDRVATADKRPQRYGTQGHCTGKATWEPLPVEDSDHLDERRAKVGLGPEADYKKLFTYCTAEMAVPAKGL
ncbi:DUF6624 domain-containing protein [Asticcacaulis taihuensis]|uniref:DUF6624 domain-containing protein n=1 Tax=Asticcacaulis taihuensis TaxID=260084 RepID=UPI003F7B6C8E